MDFLNKAVEKLGVSDASDNKKKESSIFSKAMDAAEKYHVKDKAVEYAQKRVEQRKQHPESNQDQSMVDKARVAAEDYLAKQGQSKQKQRGNQEGRRQNDQEGTPFSSRPDRNDDNNYSSSDNTSFPSPRGVDRSNKNYRTDDDTSRYGSTSQQDETSYSSTDNTSLSSPRTNKSYRTGDDTSRFGKHKSNYSNNTSSDSPRGANGGNRSYRSGGDTSSVGYSNQQDDHVKPNYSNSSYNSSLGMNDDYKSYRSGDENQRGGYASQQNVSDGRASSAGDSGYSSGYGSSDYGARGNPNYSSTSDSSSFNANGGANRSNKSYRSGEDILYQSKPRGSEDRRNNATDDTSSSYRAGNSGFSSGYGGSDYSSGANPEYSSTSDSSPFDLYGANRDNKSGDSSRFGYSNQQDDSTSASGAYGSGGDYDRSATGNRAYNSGYENSSYSSYTTGGSTGRETGDMDRGSYGSRGYQGNASGIGRPGGNQGYGNYSSFGGV